VDSFVAVTKLLLFSMQMLNLNSVSFNKMYLILYTIVHWFDTPINATPSFKHYPHYLSCMHHTSLCFVLQKDVECIPVGF